MFAYSLEIVVSYLSKLEAEIAISSHSQEIAEEIMNGHINDEIEDDGLAQFKRNKKESKKKNFFDDL